MDGMTLDRELEIDAGAVVALIGGGGKTSCLGALTQALRARPQQALITTTTKIWPPDGIHLVLWREQSDPKWCIAASLETEGIVALGQRLDADGKLLGVSPEVLCDVFLALADTVVLCEADGAAGKPLKVHAEHEPVVPACATHLLIVAGMDAVGATVRDAVHRADHFAATWGVPLTERLLPRHVAESLLGSAMYAPAGARMTFILSKCDSEARVEAAHQVAALLSGGCRQADVLGVSFGELTVRFPSLYSF